MHSLTPCSTCGPLNNHQDGLAPCRPELVEWSRGDLEWWPVCLLCGRPNS